MKNRTRNMIAAGVAIVAIAAPANVAHATRTTCPAGTYGIAGDWGLGSLRADTYRNRVWVRRHAPNARVAYRANHNIRPARCV